MYIFSEKCKEAEACEEEENIGNRELHQPCKLLLQVNLTIMLSLGYIETDCVISETLV